MIGHIGGMCAVATVGATIRYPKLVPVIWTVFMAFAVANAVAGGVGGMIP